MTAATRDDCYAEIETPGATIYVPHEPGGDARAFDPHGVAEFPNTCIACAREIKVMAHRGSGYCAQTCQALFRHAIELYCETNGGRP